MNDPSSYSESARYAEGYSETVDRLAHENLIGISIGRLGSRFNMDATVEDPNTPFQMISEYGSEMPVVAMLHLGNSFDVQGHAQFAMGEQIEKAIVSYALFRGEDGSIWAQELLADEVSSGSALATDRKVEVNTTTETILPNDVVRLRIGHIPGEGRISVGITAAQSKIALGRRFNPYVFTVSGRSRDAES